MHTRRRQATGFTTLAIHASLTGAALAGGPTPQLLMVTGATAPGTDGALFAECYEPPAVDEAGRVLFLAGIERDGVSVDFGNDYGMWVTESGTTLLVREGDPAPGTTGPVFNYFTGEPSLVGFRGGRVAFYAALRDDGGGIDSTNSSGIWAGPLDAIDLIARAGDGAPGTEGAVFEDFNNPSLTASGLLAFPGFLVPGVGDATPGHEGGSWIGVPGSLAVAARRGDPAPGTPSNFWYLSDPIVSDSGEFAVGGEIETGVNGVTYMDSDCLWLTRGGTLELLAREASPVPGIAGAEFGIIASPTINGVGEVAFYAVMQGAVTGYDNAAIFTGDHDTLGLLVREGDEPPGVPGARFLSFSFPLITDTGRVLFYAALRVEGGVNSTNDEGIWEGTPGELRLVARKGDEAPGTGGARFLRLLIPITNNRGDVVLRADLRPGEHGVTTDNDRGIWARPAGATDFTLIAREGDMIDVDPSPGGEDRRTIGNFFPFRGGAAGGHGQPSMLNEAGRLAYTIVFDDDSTAVFALDLESLPCSLADLAEPLGTLDLADVLAFVEAFGLMNSRADLDGNGLFDLADIVAFVDTFNAGCP
ncbi:MAG: hypothetical protein H6810_06365 [Phycisphaeraceae bacterium]|nr:MAG: hypothetical protein H6810_06365 [Phycisphaeraceae bacterium]